MVLPNHAFPWGLPERLAAEEELPVRLVDTERAEEERVS